MISEGGGVGLSSLFGVIYVGLRKAVGLLVGVEGDVAHLQAAVGLEQLSVAHSDFDAGGGFIKSEGAHSGDVLAEVEEIEGIGEFAHLHCIQNHLSAYCGVLLRHEGRLYTFHRHCIAPGAVIETGGVPKGDFQPGVVNLACVDVVAQAGSGGAFPGGVCGHYLARAVAIFKVQLGNHTGASAPGGILETPGGHLAYAVEEAVAQSRRNHVLALCEA